MILVRLPRRRERLSVGYKLYREIRDFAPSDWSSSELVVALIIADDANDATRYSWIPLQLLCQRTRLKASSVRGVLAKMASSGFEFRVVHGYGKDGRPVFAAKGHAVDYVVPDMVKGAEVTAPYEPEPVDNFAIGADIPAPIANGKALNLEPKALKIDPKGAEISAPLPTIPSVSPHLTKQPLTEPHVEGGGLSTGQERSSSNGHGYAGPCERAAIAAINQER